MPSLNREVMFVDGHGYEVVMPKNLPVRILRRHKTVAECTIRGQATVHKRAGQDQEIRNHRIPESYLTKVEATSPDPGPPCAEIDDPPRNLDGATYIAGMTGMPEPD